jgi:hypothetical protein
MIDQKDRILEKLRLGNCTAIFLKADGTQRTMLCTLQESQIPESARPKGEVKKKSDDALAVWDIEKQAWRSFRYDSLEQFI